MIDYDRIILSFYEKDTPLYNILYVHSQKVAQLAVSLLDKHPEIDADRDFVYAAAMLHDIGICRCDAPGIECNGNNPYICHGTLGGQMIRSLDASLYGCTSSDLEAVARVCERHTGTGLTREQIVSQGLPLPPKDLTPETVAEQLVCYADKFFSKTHLDRQKTYEQAERSLMKFGEHGVAIFRGWKKRFS